MTPKTLTPEQAYEQHEAVIKVLNCVLARLDRMDDSLREIANQREPNLIPLGIIME